MKARIHITLKSGVLDPQGKAIQQALTGLGFDAVEDVRQGKYIEVELSESDAEAARTKVSDMCEKLLANTVIENYDIEIVD
ncbi:MAG: phosphoribosylformylglycinamidine synthase subunit PurS [Alphaproteobacteria bacterium]|nr:phosphoribosylformylglycinamidine synthase subunit PurS [Alphaproteobacteria bacterium]MCZ6589721.1 phosphoribosylformylglycinamidine synthase subunit PurS [Alphaproteobacteria bacterium]MCZ6837728.1 phosphoribosylformylglycinamidine synthase subunit PurS [Alphaproteobacteria bacterium]MCZ6845651.1 phosphoribosylformylglycinamidine synthase subunit PurS [Alphaproteobacteria bacterium]